jgi:hypothetical protein
VTINSRRDQGQQRTISVSYGVREKVMSTVIGSVLLAILSAQLMTWRDVALIKQQMLMVGDHEARIRSLEREVATRR